ncbi:hypothetical protein AVEN_55741-1 [Araneus ventricosus]|uniref:Uncharacterized protein n=1 Tax=Araneus ventricosus TaxID=182803 RepID=A0A4Y2ULR8_ARAVE|nr:hypothetical protein AVEN_55741-1 [Araneus ventricosus]
MICSGDEQIPPTTNMRSSSRFIIGKSRNAMSPFDGRPGWLSNRHSHGPCNPSGYVILGSFSRHRLPFYIRFSASSLGGLVTLSRGNLAVSWDRTVGWVNTSGKVNILGVFPQGLVILREKIMNGDLQ